MPRLPANNDFPSHYIVHIVPPPNGKPPANVLLMLHGIGDSASNFGVLGQRLNLPETVAVAVQGPAALPFDLSGYHWGDDIIFDQATGQMDLDTGFSKSTRLVRDIIEQVLITKCGFRHRQIHVFGLGQGGMVALSVARAISGSELGGIVDLGGPLPASNAEEQSVKAQTPVLVAHGSSKSAITTKAAKAIKGAFSTVTFHQWRRPGDGMATNRDEMLPIMRFLASRMQSLAGVPPGAQEVT